MKKVIIGGILVAVLVGGLGIIAFSSESTQEVNNEQNQLSQNTESTQQTDETKTVDEAAPAEPSKTVGEYTAYSEDKLNESADTNRVLFFHAEWCSTCKFYENDIKAAGVPEGITILEADYDTETALKEKYGVTVQSTFVLLDGNGNVVKVWPFAGGLQGAESLYEAIEAEV